MYVCTQPECKRIFWLGSGYTYADSPYNQSEMVCDQHGDDRQYLVVHRSETEFRLHQKAALLLPRNRATVSAGGAPNAALGEVASLHDVVEVEIRLTAGGAGEHRGDYTPAMGVSVHRMAETRQPHVTGAGDGPAFG
jgi:hypothetical protein